MKRIIVIGSSNTDMVVCTDKMPTAGETVIGGRFIMNPGGKGANQAVAVSRLGGNLTFVSRLGNDIFGTKYLDGLKAEGIDTAHVSLSPDAASGVALITVDATGENSIVVAPGANMTIGREDIDAVAPLMDANTILLMQLEIPVETVEYAARVAHGRGAQVVLNPAPACKLPQTLFPLIHLITPNRVEAEALTGIAIGKDDDAEKAARRLLDMGVDKVVITLGSGGSYVNDGKKSYFVATTPVKAVDTTAAGDTYNGALCVALAEGKPLAQAVEWASRAAAISVTRLGAQQSIPRRDELTSFF